MRFAYLFSIFVLLFLFPAILQANLQAPANPLVLDVQEHSAKLQWEWQSDGIGLISDFEIDIALKGDAVSCGTIRQWDLQLVGATERKFQKKGLARGETYCWKIMARAVNSAENSAFTSGPEFTMQAVSETAPFCGDGTCNGEIGEDTTTCLRDCPSNGGGNGGGSGDGGNGGNTRDRVPGNFNPISAQTLTELIDTILNFLFWLSILVVPILVIYAGFLYVGGGADPARLMRARMILLWTAVGFTLILLSRGLPIVLKNLL